MVNDTSVSGFTCTTIRRDIKYPRIEFKTGNLVLVLPKHYDKEDELIDRHKRWIENKKRHISSAMRIISEKSLEEPKKKEDFQELVYREAQKICKHLNTKINKIYFRKMRTKWGSCSHCNNLTLNSLLAYLPDHLIEYVIFHEIAHTKERKHADNFWNVIERKFKDHQKREMELFGYWFLIQRELRNGAMI